ncbi:MAG TPA: YbhB/YbcL family Raf kinase inhibitor-like protein [Chryseosolibacter sp.]|nr:YbhB/YbcL family Raf kinase inhibitor-like protein [Chryseosolibacter sp.]
MTTIEAKATLMVSSPDFKHGDYIPMKYTCEGQNINPALDIKGIPKEAISLTLIMDDPDAPGGTFDHWLVWNIHPAETIAQDNLPGIAGKNSKGQNKYMGPCPPSGTHRYFFKVFALDTTLNLPAQASKQMLEQAMQDHVLAYGELIGLYKKHK